jgi:UDP-N-acetyl-2-amino-2-deoxyglucuronate dehydrogenase
MKNFAITGVAGYIAPRHLLAIKNTGNNLVAALDPHDSVGILDKFSFNVAFFTEYERFDRHLSKMRKNNHDGKIDFLSICAPNHLHDAHIRLALRLGADVICEKPLVIKPSNLDNLQELELETGHKIYNVLQLRVHPSLIKLREKIQNEKKNTKHEVVMTYITSRGLWYKYSWKGNDEKSGGVMTNIGIHFFDMLIWMFGNVQSNEVYLQDANKSSGFLELENANVRWYLSIDQNDLPDSAIKEGRATYRSITVDDNDIEFTNGFTDLHTSLYQVVLDGKGFGIVDARPAIETVYNIRNSKVNENQEYLHPFLIIN